MNSSKKDSSIFLSHTIAFYNTENLFDIYDSEKTIDSDLTPTADKRWTAKRFRKKINNIGFTIANIGKDETNKHPALIGLAEVENGSVINNLILSSHLKSYNYNYVHYNSKDERGIDVALVFDPSVFKVESSQPFSIKLFNNAGKPDYTRDILLVTGVLEGVKIHIILNHWSSRRAGTKETEHKRLAASNKVGEIISNLKNTDNQSKIIVMGDFNEDPFSYNVKRLVDGFQLYNPMEKLRSYSRGTSNHNRQWNVFDQIFFTDNLFNPQESSLQFENADIFDADFLKNPRGKYKGTPFRTYVGKKYHGGYSDHFPVYITLKK
ncbi:endonuclease/exonuclease/phosphatase family protein [Formosa maritima]|uniref:Endonuclease n=1 Tax=Formosa maritima TaxID=2592046 RepID=A0A5D0GRE5_9FLAO|nr:endonuclease [Formosa maritima]TYA60102.1 endonuclease [Formosa maritima]